MRDSSNIHQPDITFFGEDLPDEFHDRLVNHDRNLVDLVIVIGTSLKVAPVSEVVRFLPADVPQVYISRDVSFPILNPAKFGAADAIPLTRLLSRATMSISTSTCSATAMSSWLSSAVALAGISSTR